MTFKPIFLTTELYDCWSNMPFVSCHSKKMRLLFFRSELGRELKLTQIRDRVTASRQLTPQLPGF